jgi:DNA-binding beta-propeller fold protein YncE
MRKYISALSVFALGVMGCASDPEGQGVETQGLASRRAALSVAQAASGLKTSKLPDYTLFESGQVRPLALSPNGKRLFAVNTPEATLEIFDIGHGGELHHVAAVPVGLEPVAVAARNNDEIWVVNHLSDSVSIVRAERGEEPRVVRTLLVGDEPRDIVFGGRKKDRAFITTAHRGQNAPYDPQLTTPGIGRADVWVFDSDDLGSVVAGTPNTIVSLFCDTPRALAVSPDGSVVYASAFLSGSRTTVISEGSVPDGGQDAGGLPLPNTNFEGKAQPETSIIVKYRKSPNDGAYHWLDELNRSWDDKVRFSLPDKDVFAIDANANPPALRPGTKGYFQSVGTTLFNMVVNPRSGKVYVSNLEARNEHRFEGPGDFARSFGADTVRGHFTENRISVLDANGVTPRHLNKHIDYSACCAPLPNEENEKSLALPTDMTISADGRTLYVAAFGSSKIGIYDTHELETDHFYPNVKDQITVSGGGPSGVVLDEARGSLYVLTRFDNSISVIDTSTRHEIAHHAMHNPEPPSITEGRRFLYDASLTSSHGDSACASCHIFADFDALGWDLGEPDGQDIPVPGPLAVNTVPIDSLFHPMKGPMTTLSLRGLDNHGAMHWRGDRTGGNDAASAQPNSGIFDERAAFAKFNPAFMKLNGRSEQLPTKDMDAFTDFILQIVYPPNPIRHLDNSLTPTQQTARDLYFGPISDGEKNCNGCHTLDPQGNAEFGVARPGFFGTRGLVGFEGLPQPMKVPHFRNLYQKVGMFGMAPDGRFPATLAGIPFMGDQVRGFGFAHDGSIDTAARFLNAGSFIQGDPGAFGLPNPNGIPFGEAGESMRRTFEAFVLAYDSNMAPIVGQQITLSHSTPSAVEARVTLLEQRAQEGECDLVAVVPRDNLRLLYMADANFYTPNKASAKLHSPEELRRIARHVPVTFTCTPPGSGVRMALDNDRDGRLDGD